MVEADGRQGASVGSESRGKDGVLLGGQRHHIPPGTDVPELQLSFTATDGECFSIARAMPPCS
jgi:hypothetical protein